MKIAKLALALGCAAMLVSCGGDDSPPRTGIPGIPTPVPTPTPGTGPGIAQCSLSARQDFALAQLNEWYLFPDLLAPAVNKAAFGDINDYIDALVAPARAASRDRYFTYMTSIAAENAYYSQGATGGFGFRLSYDEAARRVFVLETFESTSVAGAMGIGRGTEILGIAEPGRAMQMVDTLMAQGGAQAVAEALGPDQQGITRVVRIRSKWGFVNDATIVKTSFTISPVSLNGALVLEDRDRRVGYLNLRTFIDTAEPALLRAFGEFQSQGLTELIIDLRYNGGGLVSIAALLGDLLNRDRGGQVFERLVYRQSKSRENETYTFRPRPQSIQPTRIAFLTTEGTASASELVINAMVPYLGQNMALIGANTYGKPVGQIALDRPACDERLRVVAFRSENAAGQGNYYTGLAGTVPVTCAAQDDYTRELTDPEEGMIRAALDWLAGIPCTPIATAQSRTASIERGAGRSGETRQLLRRDGGSTIEREVPGLF